MEQAKVTYHLTARQSLAYRLLTAISDDAVLYGGAKGGGKSFFLCLWVDYWIRWLSNFFGLKYVKGQSAMPLGFIGRKQGVDFYHTTLETFKRVIPADHYVIKEKQQEIVFNGVAKVFYGGLDDKERVKKFNSAENCFFAIDQAEETNRPDIDVLQASLRFKYRDKRPPYKQFFTANPADCWLKEDFIDNPKPGYAYIPALPTDNPHLPDNYANTLTNAFKYNPPLLRAYLHGDWLSLQATNSLVSTEQIESLKKVQLWPKTIRRLVVCDPSLGGDECVIFVMENYEIIAEKSLSTRDTMKIAGEMKVIGNRYKTQNYAVDAIGIGNGIGSRLRELMSPEETRQGYKVIEIESAAESEFPEQFANIRAEFCWHLAELVQDKKIPYPEDEELRRQLYAYRFKVINSNGKILMEEKKITKKALGRSPDRADCYMMGLWATEKTLPIIERDIFRSGMTNPAEQGSFMAA